jgi:glutamate synthase domain-containing protein 1
MRTWSTAQRDEKVISGCAVVGIMNEDGVAFDHRVTSGSGVNITMVICTMMERGNGLGAGFAGYGLYPDLNGTGVSTSCIRTNRLARRRRYNCLGHDPYIFMRCSR